MVTRKTAFEIVLAYDEITKGEALLKDMKELADASKAEFLRDAFGRQKNLQLGIPCGENRHQLFDVAPALAKQVIKAHIAEKRSLLAVLNETASEESRRP